MKNELVFAVIGGDRRQWFAAEFLKEAGYTVHTFAMMQGLPYTELKQMKADVYILPLPVTRDGKQLYTPECDDLIPVSFLTEVLPSDAAVFAGRTDDPRWSDYSVSEYFALQNAIPTAEGALMLAMQNRNTVLCGSSVGVIGFGKIGRAVAERFHRIGADISVFARREEVRREIRGLGYAAYGIDAIGKNECSLLINTVPERILNHGILSALSKETFFLELASPPYGADPDLLRELGLRNLVASGIPGRYFPKTAGIAVAKTVLHSIMKG